MHVVVRFWYIFLKHSDSSVPCSDSLIVCLGLQEWAVFALAAVTNAGVPDYYGAAVA